MTQDKLTNHFSLARVEHKESVFGSDKILDGFPISCRTGNKVANIADTRPGTLFFLKRNNTLISKALCSYFNKRIVTAGPTIELFETAAAWRGQVHGARFIQAIESHFEGLFGSIYIAGFPVRFAVSDVTKREARRWFQNRGFESWDEWDEELGKMLGVSSRKRRKKRVANPPDNTPSTFRLNWGYSGNGSADPICEANVVTLMGPPTTACGGRGQDFPSHHICIMETVVKILRKQGFSFQVPDEYEFMSEEDLSEQEREIDFFANQYYENNPLTKDNEALIYISVHHGWLYVGCVNEGVATMVKHKLEEHFVFARVEHTEMFLSQAVGCTISCRTGDEREASFDTSPGTLFFLKKGNNLILKALCSYRDGNCTYATECATVDNSTSSTDRGVATSFRTVGKFLRMDWAGPTVEQFETAEEWRGCGSLLLKKIEAHFTDGAFGCIREAGLPVKFNICDVTSLEASRWFQSRAFQKLLGMDSELAKIFGE